VSNLFGDHVDVATLVLSGITLLLLWARLRDKRGSGLVSSAMGLLAPLQNRIATLEADLESLKRHVSDLETQNGELWRWGRINYTRVLELGGDPEPLPSLK
jgi:hypothetical protein